MQDPLIGSSELARRLPGVKLCDIRWSLTDPGHGRATYESGHIPGAVFVDLDQDLTGSEGPGRHPLPAPGVFARTLGRLGIFADDEVVVYDDVAGSIAARMWWMLTSIGHPSVRLLDGGYQTWLTQDRPIETGHNEPTLTTYPEPAGFAGVVTNDQIEGRVLIDARAPERYRGDTEPVDPKAGHIPGALNLPTAGNLGPEATFRDLADLAERYGSVGPDPVVSCGSGVSACHDAIAMVVAGHAMPDVYIGSFSEWSRLDLPVATGPDP